MKKKLFRERYYGETKIEEKTIEPLKKEKKTTKKGKKNDKSNK